MTGQSRPLASAWRSLACACAVVAALASGARPIDAQPRDFRIVVIEGEDATNIIQQGTAVAPVIEVRDRNDQPVAGAVVTFGIRRGSARFANGARQLIATTDTSGRAIGTGLTPTGNGTLQISVSARVQGQVVSATITQSNVATAAQAAQAGQAGASTGGGVSGTGAATGGAGAAGAGAAAAAGGAAGGSAAGGGLSALAITGIAAGVGGAAVVTVEATKDDSPDAPSQVTYSGQYSGTFVLATATAFATNPTSCVSTRTMTGILTLTLRAETSGSVSGSGTTTVQQSPVSDVGCSIPFTGGSNPFAGTASGTGDNVFLAAQNPLNGTAFFGAISGTSTLNFSGALSGGIITGAVVFAQTANGTSDGSNGRPAGAPITLSGSTSVPVTLH